MDTGKDTKHGRRLVVAGVGAAVVAVAAAAWWLHGHGQGTDADRLDLGGNVDIRQVSLAFDTSERIVEMSVREGDRVHAGQVLGRLDTRTPKARLAQADAQVEAAQQALDRLRHGSRPEEVAQAEAAARAAEAEVAQFDSLARRLQSVSDATQGQGVSQQDLDNAKNGRRAAQARLDAARQSARLVVAGPRREDIAQAQAQLDAARANRALLVRAVEESELRAPVDAVVRSRLLEPGEIASPQRPAYTLAITQPKWVRAYVSEPQLPRVKPGLPATVGADGLGGDTLPGRVAFVSSVAEFTPKSVETPELRTSLVYEIRVMVDDPQDRLRLGMPATVHLRLDDRATAASAPARAPRPPAAETTPRPRRVPPANAAPPMDDRPATAHEAPREAHHAATPAPALRAEGLRKRFVDRESRRATDALDDVALEVPAGQLTALVGPDGAGKTTLIRLAAGLLRPDAGRLEVLGIDVQRDPQAVQDRLGYMPQRFGLYEDLSVQENLDLYADLHGVPAAERAAQFERLLSMTDLAPFTARLAGQLSGGMKQKLGLACTLVRRPDLLLLDEPTVGVDPLSRRELWQIVEQLVREDGLTVLLSTTSLDEAERSAQVVLLRDGRVLARGTPAQLRAPARGRTWSLAVPAGEPPRRLQARLLDRPDLVVDAVPHAGAVRLVTLLPDPRPVAEAMGLDPASLCAADERVEDGFMTRLRDAADARHEPAPSPEGPPEGPPAVPPDARLPDSPPHSPPDAPPSSPPTSDRGAAASGEPVIDVRDLVRRFGDFTAVAHTTFTVDRGEVFGLLGPNGAGKTTTFRMLCGLLPPTSGSLRVAGLDMRTAPGSARRRIGYVSQKFALYGNLTSAENLEFFAGAYGLPPRAARRRARELAHEFGLERLLDTPSGQLPGGYRQRLAMAAALVHTPEILFLDEPTSGADALARRAFWRRITALAEAGTTVVVTTHFMEEAEYCDRIVIQDAGEVLALGPPGEVRAGAGDAPDMEHAFIAIVERARARRRAEAPA